MVLTDHGRYVVKWQENAQHRRVLINEVIAALLLRRLRIASPEWAMVNVDERFIRDNPEASISLKHLAVSVKAGWHFGSKVPVDPEKRCIFDCLPWTLSNRLTNLEDFFKVFVFDLWTDNRDSRQAIFFAVPGSRFTAQMIDNGFSFGFDGFNWRLTDRPIHKEYPWFAAAYLCPEATAQFEVMIREIQTIVGTAFEHLRHVVPADWMADDDALVAQIFDHLRSRAERLPDLLADAKARLTDRVKLRLK